MELKFEEGYLIISSLQRFLTVRTPPADFIRRGLSLSMISKSETDFYEKVL